MRNALARPRGEPSDPAGTRPGWTMILGWTALGTVALLLAIEVAWALVTMPHVDWQTYLNAWHRLVGDQGLYGPAQLGGPNHLIDQVLTGYAYPPPAVILMAPFTALPFGEVFWHVANVGVFVTGTGALVRREVGRTSAGALAGAFVPFLIVAPFWDGVITGNVNLAIVGLLAWSWAAPDRWIGPMAGVLAVVRVFPGTLAVQRLRATGWRGALVPVGLAIGLVVVTLPIVGLQSWTDYATALSNAVPGCDKQVDSLACVLSPATGPASAKAITVGLAGLCVLGSIMIKAPLASFTLVALAWVVPLPDLSPHYLLPLFLPAYIVAARAFRRLSGTTVPRPASRW